jgi:hypothetical protein
MMDAKTGIQVTCEKWRFRRLQDSLIAKNYQARPCRAGALSRTTSKVYTITAHTHRIAEVRSATKQL